MKKDSDLPKNSAKPIGLKNNIVILESKNELLLYDLKRDKAFCLNETSSIIWNLCNGVNTVEDVRKQMSIQLKTQVSEEVIWLALHNLKNEKLLSNCEEIEINFNGLNRREVIRKIGLATMITLPLISTLIAPMATAAGSAAVCPAADCICQDLLCLNFGPVAPNQQSCKSSCGGGTSCLCTGPFFCFGMDERFGACRTV